MKLVARLVLNFFKYSLMPPCQLYHLHLVL